MNRGSIKKPTILLDEEKARLNLSVMAEKARNAGMVFRPHFKTHQSGTVGEWFREAGVGRITVSSTTMAGYFASLGWKDITIAFPVNPLEISDINILSEKINLNILVSDYRHLTSFIRNFKGPAGVFIKINTGYNRSGVDWNHDQELVRIVKLVSRTKALRVIGLLTHSGHTYSASSVNEVLDIHEDTRHKMLRAREFISGSSLCISVGDTPSCSLATDFSGIDEIRPGNFIFYDLMQARIGSCNIDQVAVAVACPVISVSGIRNEAVLYGGAVHLSKECIINEDGSKCFGLAMKADSSGWDTCSVIGYVKSLSQEHGILSISEGNRTRIKPGDIVAVIPVHSCLTVDLMRTFLTLTGRYIRDFSEK